jgi:hypothetical protein
MIQKEILTPPKAKTPGHGLILGASKVWEEEDHKPGKQLLAAARNLDYRYWPRGDLQDQGNVPHCVEYAGRGLLEASPARNQTEHIYRGTIYQWCQDHDEWAGDDYDGTSVHALMKWLKLNGYVKSYEWAETVEQVHAHIVTRGPAVLGTTWWQSMSYVDEFGYARIGGANYGGHAYFLRGRNRLAKDPVTGVYGKSKLVNSWGEDYGEGGESWINDNDLQALIDDYGEIALPVEMMVKL